MKRDEKSPFTKVILNLEMIMSSNNLLTRIKETGNIDLVDSSNQTILHHFINGIKPENITNKEQLQKVVNTVRDIATLVSDSALHSLDEDGLSGLQVAANCVISEIFWVALRMGMPSYVIPYINEGNAYNSFSSYSPFTGNISGYGTTGVDRTAVEESRSAKVVGDWLESDLFD